MSYTPDKRSIQCDSEGCGSETRAPVTLRPTAAHHGAIAGWLFVQSGDALCRHYCPHCASLYLRSHDTATEPETRTSPVFP